MAIYHCSLKVFSRSEGHSAVAAAAYRSGSILKDERAGKTHRYHKRTGVADTFILAPPSAPKSFLTRASLWNAAEASENRKNSRVAREVILALPHELSDKARAELTRDMGLYLLERYRVAVDVAIHSPCEGDGHDPRNHHAHLLFTTREVTKEGLGAKTRILDDKVTGPQEIEVIREVWETLANDALERAGFPDAKIDRRTLEAQGVDRIPQTHEGKASKNAAAYESVLTKDFKKADRGEDDEETTEGEEEGKGEKGSSSGSAGSSGNQSPSLQSKPREDNTGLKIDYPALDQKQTRTTFNDEIKALNEKRAAFGDKPLLVQIEQLDRLMEQLDRRVEKLQVLESKTSFTATIKNSIASVVKLAAGFLVNRAEARTLLKLSAEAKQARKERQIIRYGRSYREGLHSKIKEMKQNMALVEAKKEDFRRYKSFVDKIDREISKHPSITTLDKEQNPPTARQVTDKEVQIKLHLKAEMIRAQIPAEFKPPTRAERQTLTASTAVNKVLQVKSEPIKIDKAAFAQPEAKPTARSEIKLQPSKAEAPPLKSAFTSKAEVQPTAKTQAEYKQPMPVKIKALEQAIAQRQAARAEAPKPADRKSWFTAADEKTRPMTDMIDRAIKQQRAAQPTMEQPKTQNQEKFTKAQERLEKQTTYSELREKTRAEAEIKRARVPPEYRAEPYEAKTNAPRAEEPQTENQSAFNNATTAENEPKPTKPRMSDTFNMKSGFNATAESEPEQRPNETPEADI